jgi:lysophospholipase L1-like esterase
MASSISIRLLPIRVHPGAIVAVYENGDHLHPNDAGYRAMGEAIDLKVFE